MGEDVDRKKVGRLHGGVKAIVCALACACIFCAIAGCATGGVASSSPGTSSAASAVAAAASADSSSEGMGVVEFLDDDATRAFARSFATALPKQVIVTECSETGSQTLVSSDNDTMRRIFNGIDGLRTTGAETDSSSDDDTFISFITAEDARITFSFSHHDIVKGAGVYATADTTGFWAVLQRLESAQEDTSNPCTSLVPMQSSVQGS